MSFLFGKKSKNEKGGPPTRDGTPSLGPPPGGQGIPTVNGVRSKERGAGVSSPIPGAGMINIEGNVTPTPEQNHDQRPGTDQDSQITPPRLMANGPGPGPGPNVNPAALYPWSQRRLTFTSNQPNPFPRYGAAVNAMASKEGEIYMMGGLVNGSTVKGDLWMIEAGSSELACFHVSTTFEGPGPRVGHASLLVGNAFIIFGGDTKLDDRDKLDDTLYLLNTNTRHWSRSTPMGFRPAGRYGHTVNLLGSKIYVFGGQVEGFFFNDLVSFDLNALQQSNSKWEVIFPSSTEGGPPEGTVPPARTNHTIISWNNKLYLFGGTNGTQWFNDVWTYDPEVMRWAQLDCIGYIPAAREGHSAALIGDVMYIFGGRTEEGTDLGDLAAFKITTRRWYTFQNMGPSPSPRSGHSMTAFGRNIVVVAGEPSSAPRDPNELALVYILDTSKIRYPNDQQIQQTPSGERVLGNRRPSQERGIAAPQARPINAPNGAPDGLNRKQSGSRESVVGQTRSPAPAGRIPESNIPNGPGLGPGPGPGPGPQGPIPQGPVPTSRLPRASMGQPPSGPPPQQQAPTPRNVIAASADPRSRTPTRDVRGYGPTADLTRNQSFENNDVSAGVPQIAAKQGPGNRSMSPAVNGRRTPSQQQQAQQAPRQQPRAEDDEYDPNVVRSRSRQGAPMQPAQPAQLAEPPTNHVDPPVNNQQLQQLQTQHQNLQSQHEGLQLEHGKLRSQYDESTSLKDKSLQELEAAKGRNAWYASELALAKKAGYQPSSSQNPVLDEKAAQQFGDHDKPLIEALVAMRAQLSEVQSSVAAREDTAAQQLAELEHQRDNAIKEAAYAKAKLAAHGGSNAGSPQPGASATDIGDEVRSGDIARKLAIALAAQNELRNTITSVTAELENERRARELAEGTADAAQRRAADFEGSHNPGEIETLRTELHLVSKSAREEAAAKTEAHAKLGLLEVDKEDLSRKLTEALDHTKQHSTALTSLKDAVSSSTNKAAVLERKLEEERQQRDAVDRKLLQLRGEHEERTAELDETARKLRDAEEMANTHAAEAKTHRQAVIAGLEKLNSRSLESRNSSHENEHIPVLKQQLESAHGLVRKQKAEADDAADKLRKAEERIAGLETFQEQSSRESLGIRKQLQEALKESQAQRAKHAFVQQALEKHKEEATTLAIKHHALKDLLDERGIAESNKSAAEDAAESLHAKELEQQLRASLQAHQETKDSIESRELETERTYREKLELLENDYQSAVHYVKGTEKMLKRMKDELTKYKKQNERLQAEVDSSQKTQSARGTDNEASAEWEQERQALRREIGELQRSVKDTHAQLEAEMQQVQAELQYASQERDQYKMTSDQAQRQLQDSTLQTRTELEQLKSENNLLESRALDAEQKVTLLLDQVGNSVTNYRRQSQQIHSGPPNANGHSHSRNLSAISSASSANPAPLNFGTGTSTRAPVHSHTKSTDTTDSAHFPAVPEAAEENGATNNNRNSLALDTLASELETLRSQWADSHRSYRLSNAALDFGPTAGSPPVSATVPGNVMSESLTSWRKRLDAEEQAREASTSPARHPKGTSPARHAKGTGDKRGDSRSRDRESGVLRPQSVKMPGALGGLSDESEDEEEVEGKSYVI